MRSISFFPTRRTPLIHSSQNQNCFVENISRLKNAKLHRRNHAKSLQFFFFGSSSSLLHRTFAVNMFGAVMRYHELPYSVAFVDDWLHIHVRHIEKDVGAATIYRIIYNKYVENIRTQFHFAKIFFGNNKLKVEERIFSVSNSTVQPTMETSISIHSTVLVAAWLASRRQWANLVYSRTTPTHGRKSAATISFCRHIHWIQLNRKLCGFHSIQERADIWWRKTFIVELKRRCKNIISYLIILIPLTEYAAPAPDQLNLIQLMKKT